MEIQAGRNVLYLAPAHTGNLYKLRGRERQSLFIHLMDMLAGAFARPYGFGSHMANGGTDNIHRLQKGA